VICDGNNGFSEFQELVGLHKFYFELLITSASFYLGIVGGMLAYVAKAGMAVWPARLSLGIPTLFSGAAVVGYSTAFRKLRDLQHWVRACKETLNFGWAPHAEILPNLSGLFALVALAILAGLIVILFRPDLLTSKTSQADPC
jgi:hypothetical protein